MNNRNWIEGFVPVLKINNRAKNVAFFQDQLGFKVLREENAFVELGGGDNKKPVLILEESPSMRTRQVNSLHKLAQLTFKVTNPTEIDHLLSRGLVYQNLYQGEKGWAFNAVSPEGAVLFFHSEDNSDHLVPVTGEVAVSSELAEGTGLTDVNLDDIRLRTPQPKESLGLYHQLFGEAIPMSFEEAQGPDLQVASADTWDLAGLELAVSEEVNLEGLKNELEQAGYDVFLGRKGRFLAFEDLNGLSLSISK